MNKNINPILFFINYKDRSKLYEKINLRVDQMINDGLENEFDFVAKKYKLSPLSKSLQAIGYKEFFPYKENEISYDELRSEIKKNTRRYAKRQITWMKKYLKYDFSNLIYRDEDMDEKILENMEKIVKETYDLQ